MNLFTADTILLKIGCRTSGSVDQYSLEFSRGVSPISITKAKNEYISFTSVSCHCKKPECGWSKYFTCYHKAMKLVAVLTTISAIYMSSVKNNLKYSLSVLPPSWTSPCGIPRPRRSNGKSVGKKSRPSLHSHIVHHHQHQHLLFGVELCVFGAQLCGIPQNTGPDKEPCRTATHVNLVYLCVAFGRSVVVRRKTWQGFWAFFLAAVGGIYLGKWRRPARRVGSSSPWDARCRPAAAVGRGSSEYCSRSCRLIIITSLAKSWSVGFSPVWTWCRMWALRTAQSVHQMKKTSFCTTSLFSFNIPQMTSCCHFYYLQGACMSWL